MKSSGADFNCYSDIYLADNGKSSEMKDGRPQFEPELYLLDDSDIVEGFHDSRENHNADSCSQRSRVLGKRFRERSDNSEDNSCQLSAEDNRLENCDTVTQMSFKKNKD